MESQESYEDDESVSGVEEIATASRLKKRVLEKATEPVKKKNKFNQELTESQLEELLEIIQESQCSLECQETGGGFCEEAPSESDLEEAQGEGSESQRSNPLDLLVESLDEETDCDGSFHESQHSAHSVEERAQVVPEVRMLTTCDELVEAYERRLRKEKEQQNEPPEEPQEGEEPEPENPDLPQDIISEDRLYKFSGTGLYATWPQCETSKEKVMANINLSWWNWCQFIVISEEDHKDGTPHLHAYIKFKTKRHFTGCHFADFLVKTEQFPRGKHGNYRMVKKPEGCFRYVIKGGKFIWKGTLPKRFQAILKGDAPKEKKVTLEDLCEKIKSGELTYDQIVLQHGKAAMLYGRRLQEYEMQVKALQEKPLKKFPGFDVEAPYLYEEIEDDDLRKQVQKIFRWVNDNVGNFQRALRQEQMYIWGPGGIGKSSLLECLEEYFRVYELPMTEDFMDKWKNDFDLIKVDEWNGSKPITFMNRLLDGQRMEMKKKGVTSITKNVKTAVMICSNKAPGDCYAGVKAWMQVEAFKSRLIVADLSACPVVGRNEDDLPIYQVLIKCDKALKKDPNQHEQELFDND